MLAEILAAPEIDVTVGGETYTIPELPARDWLLALLDDNWVTAVVPGLLDDPETLTTGLLVGTVDVDELVTAVHAAVAVASGRTWWEAMHLVGISDDDTGAIAGELLLSGINPDRVTLAGWCAAVYQLCVRNQDDKGRTRFDASIALPPPTVNPDEVEDWDTVQW